MESNWSGKNRAYNFELTTAKLGKLRTVVHYKHKKSYLLGGAYADRIDEYLAMDDFCLETQISEAEYNELLKAR